MSKIFKFMKEHNVVFGIIILLILFLLLVLALTNPNLNHMFSNDSSWIGFFGSYFGSIASGFFALLAMSETNKNSNKNLSTSIIEGRNLQDLNNRVLFCNELASIIADFCSEVKSNFYFALQAQQSKDNLIERESYLKLYQNELVDSQESLRLVDSNTSIEKIQQMERTVKQKEILVSKCEFFYNVEKSELDSNLNKIYSSNINSLYFLLKVKLNNIEESKKLLEKIDKIYDLSSPNIDDFMLNKKELNSLTEQLLNETAEFIDSYTHVQLENDIQ